jgi:hypothetical protein
LKSSDTQILRILHLNLGETKTFSFLQFNHFTKIRELKQFKYDVLKVLKNIKIFRERKEHKKNKNKEGRKFKREGKINLSLSYLVTSKGKKVHLPLVQLSVFCTSVF